MMQFPYLVEYEDSVHLSMAQRMQNILEPNQCKNMTSTHMLRESSI